MYGTSGSATSSSVSCRSRPATVSVGWWGLVGPTMGAATTQHPGFCIEMKQAHPFILAMCCIVANCHAHIEDAPM